MHKQYFMVPEGTSIEMLSPKFWTRRITGQGKRWLKESELSAFNEELLTNAERTGLERFYRNLEEFPTRVELDSIRAMIGETIPEGFFTRTLVSPEGEEVPAEIRDDILENATNLMNQDMVLQMGLTTRRTHLRAMPTDLILVEGFLDNDDLQLTSVSLGSPFVALARSRDKSWLFVQTRTYRGWIKGDHVAVAKNRSDVIYYCSGEEFLLACGSRVEIEPDPFLPDTWDLFLQMGDRLPLEKPKDVENPHSQGPYGCYAVKIPFRNRKGTLEFRTGLIRASEDVSRGFMKLTTKNVLKQAFKMLGERYGWGGSYNRRDCSRFIQDIYKCFGLELPRDSGVQEKLIPSPRIEFTGSAEDREMQLASLRPGNPLYMPGHTMIYLGRCDGRFYVIHDGSGYTDRHNRQVSVHGVFVMELSLRTIKSQKSYIELLTSAPEIDKGLLKR